jgi:TRAP-type C4-dicarboxylate transport system substrate-binding protein
MPIGPVFGRRRLLASSATAGLAAPFVRRTEAQGGRILRLGHVHAAEGPVARGIGHAAEVLRERSGGKLRLEQIPEARLGPEREMLEQVHDRALDLCLAQPVSLTIGCARAMVLDTPFLARDFDHVLRMFESPTYQLCMRGLEAGDLNNVYGYELRAFAPWYLGTRHMTTRDRPIRAPEDLAGLRMRVGDGRTIPAMMRALGALPVPMPEAEMHGALGAGAIDGQEGSLAVVADNRLLDVQRCLSLTGHVVMSLLPLANTQAWHLFRDAERDALEGALREGGVLCTHSAREREQRLLREFGRRDIQVVEADRTAFRRALTPFYEGFRQWLGGGTLDLMEAL